MKYIIAFIFVFITNLSFSQEIDVLNMKPNQKISLDSILEYQISFNKKNNLTENFKKFNKNKPIDIPKNAKAIWFKIDLKNTNPKDTLFLSSKDRISNMEVFVVNKNRLAKIGHTGFSTTISNVSIKGDMYNIAIPCLEKSQTIIIKIVTDKYKISIPQLFISKTLNKNLDLYYESTFTIVVISLELCFFVLSILFLIFGLKIKKPSPFLVFFQLICLIDALYFLSRSNIIIFETKYFPWLKNAHVWNVLGDLNVLLYYLFFSSFFKIRKNTFTFFTINLGIVFWLLQAVIEVTDFESINLIIFWIV